MAVTNSFSFSASAQEELNVLAERRAAYERDGVVHIKAAIPADQMAMLRQALEEIFAREDLESKGIRTDMTAAAEELRSHGKGNSLLEELGKETQSSKDANGSGKFLTEIEAGRWHKGLREFEHVSALPSIIGELLQTQELRFFMDHLFLKEPQSPLQTGYHQDAPYFPFEGEQAAVCWVCIDPVTAENGGMRYVQGSHLWGKEFSPSTLITDEATHTGHGAPKLPADLGEKYRILSWDCEPGDVIIHHPRTIHGSRGNTSSDRRRLAASIRYVGDDVRWKNKPTNVSPTRLASMWHFERRMDLLSALRFLAATAIRRALRSLRLAPAGKQESDYEDAVMWCYTEMKDGDAFDARDCARTAFPVVWRKSNWVAAEGAALPRSRL